MGREQLCVRKKHHHIQAYPDVVTYPYKFQKALLLLLGKKCFLFAGFDGYSIFCAKIREESDLTHTCSANLSLKPWQVIL